MNSNINTTTDTKPNPNADANVQQSDPLDYDLVTPAWPAAYGFQSQPNGFLYLKNSRLVFITDKETVFDADIHEVESASFRMTGSIGLHISGKKYRVVFATNKSLAGGSVAASASRLLPLAAGLQYGLGAVGALAMASQFDSAEKQSEKWKMQLIRYPSIKIHSGGGQIVATGPLLLFFLFGMPIIGILLTVMYYFYQDGGPSSLILTLPPTVFVVFIVTYIWRKISKRAHKEAVAREQQLKEIDADPKVQLISKQLNDVYQLELIGDTLRAYRYWVEFYQKKGETVTFDQLVDDTVNDLLDTYSEATSEMVLTIMQAAETTPKK